MAADLSGDALEPCTPIVVAPEVFAATGSRYIADAIRTAASRRELVSLALSGGKGPRPIYQALARTPDIPWNRVEIYFADERAVPPDDRESNYRLVRESLLNLLPLTPAGVHRMEGEQEDLARAASAYERLLPAQLDVLVLGIGADGHTASLFPHHPAMSEERRRVLGVQGPTPPRWRITITPPVIRAARTRLLLAAGESKAQAVARACHGPYDPRDCPAQLARDGVWIVDKPAASRLRTAAS